MLGLLKEETREFAEGSDMGHGSKRRAKDNTTVFGQCIWRDKVPIYKTGKTVLEAGLQWQPEFGFG